MKNMLTIRGPVKGSDKIIYASNYAIAEVAS